MNHHGYNLHRPQLDYDGNISVSPWYSFCHILLLMKEAKVIITMAKLHNSAAYCIIIVFLTTLVQLPGNQNSTNSCKAT